MRNCEADPKSPHIGSSPQAGKPYPLISPSLISKYAVTAATRTVKSDHCKFSILISVIGLSSCFQLEAIEVLRHLLFAIRIGHISSDKGGGFDVIR